MNPIVRAVLRNTVLRVPAEYRVWVVGILLLAAAGLYVGLGVRAGDITLADVRSYAEVALVFLAGVFLHDDDDDGGATAPDAPSVKPPAPDMPGAGRITLGMLVLLATLPACGLLEQHAADITQRLERARDAAQKACTAYRVLVEHCAVEMGRDPESDVSKACGDIIGAVASTADEVCQ